MWQQQTHSLSLLLIKVQELQGAVLLQGPVQVPQLPTDPGDHGVVGQAPAAGTREQTQEGLSAWQRRARCWWTGGSSPGGTGQLVGRGQPRPGLHLPPVGHLYADGVAACSPLGQQGIVLLL